MNKRRYFLLMLAGAALFALAACSPAHDTVQVQPLTPVQKQVIHSKLRAGIPVLPTEQIETDTTSPEDACNAFTSQLPPTFDQGYLTVPEDWSHPEGRQIKVFYYARLAHDAQGTPLAPVVFFNGGPGGDSHSSYEILERQPGARTLSFVYIDQRGTGCSDPYPSDPVSAETAQRLTLYGTRGIVQDAEAIRAKLFGTGSKWRVFGQSFGGYVVHRYAQIAPESIDAAYAHGSSLMTDAVQWLVLRIRSQHRVAADYFAQFPADRDAIAKARSQIPDNRCFTDGTNQVCGSAVLDAATILLGFHDEWNSLHHWILALLNADGTLNDDVFKKFLQYFVFGEYTNNGFAASVIDALELSPGVGDSSGCSQVMSRLEAAGEDPASWPVNECRLLSAIKSPWDPIVDAMHAIDPLSSDLVLGSLTAHPNLRFFLYSGEKDVFVPVESFSEEVAHLGSRITYRDFPNSGHDGFYSEQQVWTDLNSAH